MQIRTKKEVSALVAVELGHSRAVDCYGGERTYLASAVLDALASAVAAALKRGDEIRIPGVGTLRPRRRKARTVALNGLGVSGQVPERLAVVFSAHEGLKKQINEG